VVDDAFDDDPGESADEFANEDPVDVWVVINGGSGN